MPNHICKCSNLQTTMRIMIKGTFFLKKNVTSFLLKVVDETAMQFSNFSLFCILSLKNLQFLCPILMENILKFYLFNFWSAPKSASDSIYITTAILSCKKVWMPTAQEQRESESLLSFRSTKWISWCPAVNHG